jgi:hypothetical protein
MFSCEVATQQLKYITIKHIKKNNLLLNSEYTKVNEN